MVLSALNSRPNELELTCAPLAASEGSVTRTIVVPKTGSKMLFPAFGTSGVLGLGQSSELFQLMSQAMFIPKTFCLWTGCGKKDTNKKTTTSNPVTLIIRLNCSLSEFFCFIRGKFSCLL